MMGTLIHTSPLNWSGQPKADPNTPAHLRVGRHPACRGAQGRLLSGVGAVGAQVHRGRARHGLRRHALHLDAVGGLPYGQAG